MSPAHSRRRNPHARRRLGAERLEDRRLLDAAGWYGYMISDADGDLFAVDLIDDVRLAWLGETDEPLYDLAFSPSGDLYGIAGGVSGPSELVRIHVDPANPTPGDPIATTLVGEIGVPGEGPLYLNSLEFRDDGTLLAAGYGEFFRNHVYTIDVGTGEATEELYLDGYEPSGDLVFDENGSLYVTTFEQVLLQIDPSLSLINEVGVLGAADFFATTYGPAPIMVGFRYFHDVYRINTADATPTYLDTLSHSQLYGILGAATVFDAPEDLGTIDFLELADQQPALGELWYRVTPARDGYFTVDLPGVSPGSGTQVVLYTQGADGDLTELASGELRADLFSATAGEEYYVRIVDAPPGVDVRMTNLVVPDGDGATIHSTDGDDTLEVEAGQPHTLTINGVGYEFDVSAADVAEFTFDGGEGLDRATLAGSGGNDVGVLRIGSAEFAGDRYTLGVTGAEIIRFEGGDGDDEAILEGSSLADAIELAPAAAELRQGVVWLSAVEVETIEVQAGGGDDRATFTGTADDEAVELWPMRGEYDGPGYSITVLGAETQESTSGGGDDELILHDSTGPDLLVGLPERTSLTGESFSLAGNGFVTVTAHADQGADTGVDALEFTGSDGSDYFAVATTGTLLSGDDYSITGWGFADIYGSGGDGSDLARVYDSRTDDYFAAAPGVAYFTGGGIVVWLYHVETVNAYSHLGNDFARLYDSKGDDTFAAQPGDATLFGDGFSNRVKGFPGAHAYSHAGRDTAEFFDTAGDDRFIGRHDESIFYGPGYYNRAKHFATINVYATDGYDEATLTDSPGNDLFYASSTAAGMIGPDYSQSLSGFDEILARSTVGGVDEAKLFDSPGPDWFTAWPDRAVMDGPGFQNTVEGFDGVHAYAGAGGLDVALLNDSDGDDTFVANPIEGVLYGPGFYNRAKFFETIGATSAAGGRDEAHLTGSSGGDRFDARPEFGALSGTGYRRQVTGFAAVYADALLGDNDEAFFTDSPSADRLDAQDNWARLSNAAVDFLYQASNFDDVEADAAGPADEAHVVDPLDFNLTLSGPWLTP